MTRQATLEESTQQRKTSTAALEQGAGATAGEASRQAPRPPPLCQDEAKRLQDSGGGGGGSAKPTLTPLTAVKPGDVGERANSAAAASNGNAAADHNANIQQQQKQQQARLHHQQVHDYAHLEGACPSRSQHQFACQPDYGTGAQVSASNAGFYQQPQFDYGPAAFEPYPPHSHQPPGPPLWDGIACDLVAYAPPQAYFYHDYLGHAHFSSQPYWSQRSVPSLPTLTTAAAAAAAQSGDALNFGQQPPPQQFEAPANLSSATAKRPAGKVGADDCKVGDDGDDCEEQSDDDDEAEIKVCEWLHCNCSFTDMDKFVAHIVGEHVNEHRDSLQAMQQQQPGASSGQSQAQAQTQTQADNAKFRCKWANCKRNSQGFNAKYKLLIHMRVHSGQKPHACDECKKKFSRLENLKIHKRSHTGDKPYSCKQPNCAKKFTNSSDRIKHHKTHIDPKPYECNAPNCNKRYTDPSSLRKHSRTHKPKLPLIATAAAAAAAIKPSIDSASATPLRQVATNFEQRQPMHFAAVGNNANCNSQPFNEHFEASASGCFTAQPLGGHAHCPQFAPRESLSRSWAPGLSAPATSTAATVGGAMLNLNIAAVDVGQNYQTEPAFAPDTQPQSQLQLQRQQDCSYATTTSDSYMQISHTNSDSTLSCATSLSHGPMSLFPASGVDIDTGAQTAADHAHAHYASHDKLCASMPPNFF